MAKNCTCSQLQETIDKIFIDDSCCCQNTVVTPTDNSCSCEPIIDLIDTDKFACASFDHNRNLKYQMIKESWLVHGTNSKTVYDAIIESQASEIMLLLKVLGGEIGENIKNYVISPIEVLQDVESGLYIVKYFKFIEGKLNICTYTIHKINDNEYETNWECDEMDDFDASQYYNKTEIDNNYATIQYITNNYYTSDIIDNNFYKKSETYNKNEIDNFFNTKVLWEKGQGQLSTQRKNTSCQAQGNYSFATGNNNIANGVGTAVLGTDNTANGNYSFVTGYTNTTGGSSNIVAGNNNTVTSDNNLTTGSNNNVTASQSGAIGYGNKIINGSCNFIGGGSNTIKTGSDNTDSNYSFSFGYGNEVTGNTSTTLGRLNTIKGESSFAAGANNKVTGDFSSIMGKNNTVNGSLSVALGNNNIVTSSSSLAVGYHNYASNHYSLSLNEANRANGLASIAAGRCSYTDDLCSFATGLPVYEDYFAKLVEPNANEGDTYYGYLVLTNAQGQPVNITENSIQNKRFTFTTSEGKYWGELTIALTTAESANPIFADRFPHDVWTGINDIIIVESAGTRYIYFLPAADESGRENIIWLFNNTDYGIRSISYASGYDGCKATNSGSHAEGYGTIAKGLGSHSEGECTFTQNEAEHACGKYNYSSNNTLFSIGIGKEEYANPDDGSSVTITRKNALEVTQDGEIYIRINEDGTENVYDLGKLLTALIDTTSLSLDDIVLDSDARQSVDTNEDPLAATTKAL